MYVYKGAIASKMKHAIKLKTSPARLAQLLQPSLAFCFSLQPMTAHRAVRRHWLQAKTKLSEIAPNFGRFFALPNFRGRAFQNLYPFYHP